MVRRFAEKFRGDRRLWAWRWNSTSSTMKLTVWLSAVDSPAPDTPMCRP